MLTQITFRLKDIKKSVQPHLNINKIKIIRTKKNIYLGDKQCNEKCCFKMSTGIVSYKM